MDHIPTEVVAVVAVVTDCKDHFQAAAAVVIYAFPFHFVVATREHDQILLIWVGEVAASRASVVQVLLADSPLTVFHAYRGSSAVLY